MDRRDREPFTTRPQMTSGNRKSSDFGDVPELRTRTGKLARKVLMDNLLSIAREGEGGKASKLKKASRKQPRYTCSICGSIFAGEAEKGLHERACEILQRGEMRSKASPERRPPRVGDHLIHSRKGSDNSKNLLKATYSLVNDFKGSVPTFVRQRPETVTNNKGRFKQDFSSNFVNDYRHFLRKEKREDEERERSRKQKGREQRRRGQRRGEDGRGEEGGGKRERDAAATAADMGNAARFDLAAYNLKWEDFFCKCQNLEILEMSDIPWLPDSLDISSFGGSTEEARASLRSLVLRWHPDKFGATIKTAGLGAKEIGTIMEKVKMTSQMLLLLFQNVERNPNPQK